MTVRGNRALLAALLRKLVDNALRHGAVPRVGGADGAGNPAVLHVDVTVGLRDGRAFVSVEDDGRGVPDDVFAGLGARFHRPAGTAASGSGLGLALARRIAELHDGRLAFAAGAGGRGFRATLGLPVPLTRERMHP